MRCASASVPTISTRAPSAEHTATLSIVSQQGTVIVRANQIATAVFVISSVYAAVVFTSTAQWIGAIVAMTLFLVGIAAFLWSFWNAVQRSRSEQVAVVQLYLLIGGVAPKPIRRMMNSLLAVQIIAGLATALARPNNADGSAGTSLALGVLVPLFGFGLNGLWAAFHGSYAARNTSETPKSVTPSEASIDQNEHHG
jgi:hypothetical protein